MSKHDAKQRDDIQPNDGTLWPWPVGNWFLPAYWLAVLLLAFLLLAFG
jgi:hypothetical protein